ncbi:MAG: ABC transporter permease [FCB group bacterium]|nr:ABC transporter permease [FCB group bacterium]
MIRMDLGNGQFWHSAYDPYDPFSLEDSHGILPENFTKLPLDTACPILISSGSIFPDGRMQSVLLKGIPPNQTVLDIPSTNLQQPVTDDYTIPAMIGSRMAEATRLEKGDFVTVRWRDTEGVFDAADLEIVHVFKTSAQSIDNGQIWLPLKTLQEMLRMENEATLVVVSADLKEIEPVSGWVFRDLDYLLQDLRAMVQSKKAGASIFYVLLLFMALLAIFDTQVLSIFRRRKEMGTLISMGMTRAMLIRIFTLEGALHGIMAILLGAVYGIPFLNWFARTGWALPEYADEMGMSIGERLYPIYGSTLVLGTTAIVLIAVTIVSFLPTRKIAKLNPVDALRGKIS